MKTFIPTKMIVALCFAVLPLTSHAASFKISWTGANGYSMAGMFSYSDSHVNTGLINAYDLDTFSITGYWGKIPIGSFQLDPTRMNFNFDSHHSTFLTGGLSHSSTGQEWNIPNNSGFGFFSGNSFQGIQIDGTPISDAKIRIGSTVRVTGIVPSTLTATPIPTPEPSTFFLLVTGLIGFLAFSWHKKMRARVVQN